MFVSFVVVIGVGFDGLKIEEVFVVIWLIIVKRIDILCIFWEIW